MSEDAIVKAAAAAKLIMIAGMILVGACIGAAAVGVFMAATTGRTATVQSAAHAPQLDSAESFTVMGDIDLGRVERLASTAQHRMRSETSTGNDLGGESLLSPNTTIHWRSESAIDSEGASVHSVLSAAAVRLSHLQKSPQAKDQNARALWHVMKALAEFER